MKDDLRKLARQAQIQIDELQARLIARAQRGHAASLNAMVLLMAAPAAGGPINAEGLFTGLFGWLKGIVLAIAGIYFLFDALRHLGQSPKDLKAAGLDLLSLAGVIVMVVMVGPTIEWVCGQVNTTCDVPF